LSIEILSASIDGGALYSVTYSANVENILRVLASSKIFFLDIRKHLAAELFVVD